MKDCGIILVSIILALSHAEEYDYQTPFSNIYSNKLWNGNGGPLSGPGSDPCVGLKYLIYLQHLIDRPDIRKIVEIGFGDWEMNQHILLEHKTYIGFDVVESLRRKTGYHREFRIIKGLKEVNESGDLLIVRDVMQHWPTPQIDYFIDNILPNFKYALLTNDYTMSDANFNIAPGGYRPLNLYKISNQKVVLQIKYQSGSINKVSILVTNPNPI